MTRESSSGGDTLAAPHDLIIASDRRDLDLLPVLFLFSVGTPNKARTVFYQLDSQSTQNMALFPKKAIQWNRLERIYECEGKPKTGDYFSTKPKLTNL